MNGSEVNGGGKGGSDLGVHKHDKDLFKQGKNNDISNYKY